MLELIFVTYVLAVISLAINAWLWFEVKDLKQKLTILKTKQKVQPKPVAKVTRPRGLWD